MASDPDDDIIAVDITMSNPVDASEPIPATTVKRYERPLVNSLKDYIASVDLLNIPLAVDPFYQNTYSISFTATDCITESGDLEPIVLPPTIINEEVKTVPQAGLPFPAANIDPTLLYFTYGKSTYFIDRTIPQPSIWRQEVNGDLTFIMVLIWPAAEELKPMNVCTNEDFGLLWVCGRKNFGQGAGVQTGYWVQIIDLTNWTYAGQTYRYWGPTNDYEDSMAVAASNTRWVVFWIPTGGLFIDYEYFDYVWDPVIRHYSWTTTARGGILGHNAHLGDTWSWVTAALFVDPSQDPTGGGGGLWLWTRYAPNNQVWGIRINMASTPWGYTSVNLYSSSSTFGWFFFPKLLTYNGAATISLWKHTPTAPRSTTNGFMLVRYGTLKPVPSVGIIQIPAAVAAGAATWPRGGIMLPMDTGMGGMLHRPGLTHDAVPPMGASLDLRFVRVKSNTLQLETNIDGNGNPTDALATFTVDSSVFSGETALIFTPRKPEFHFSSRSNQLYEIDLTFTYIDSQAREHQVYIAPGLALNIKIRFDRLSAVARRDGIV